MFQCRHRVTALRSFNTLSQFSSSTTPKCCHFLQLISLNLSTFFSTSPQSDQQQSFTISYLTKQCGLSPQAALKASKRVRFDTAAKPESVAAFFREQGFSPAQIQSIIIRAPYLLTCNPIKRVLPKFQFLASKGASTNDIVTAVTRTPDFLRSSLENRVIPTYELVRRFLPSDERAIATLLARPTLIGDTRFQPNVKLLLDIGVTESNVCRLLLRIRPSILCSNDFIEAVKEVKGLGFDPRMFNFIEALLAKKTITRSQWDAKIDALKRWGWSEDAIFHAFRRQPSFMLKSRNKLNAVMSFWVDQLGWDTSTLLLAPILFGYSLEKRIIPRASVIQYLLSKGLMKEGASLVTPFTLTDKLFLQKFVTCFGEEETSRLLKLYKEGC